jgi:hypothetical protein
VPVQRRAQGGGHPVVVLHQQDVHLRSVADVGQAERSVIGRKPYALPKVVDWLSDSP